jgi:Toprim domain
MNNILQSIWDTAAQAAARLNLTLGRDHVWRGRCPACGYGKPTLAIKATEDRITIACAACGSVPQIGTILGLSADLIAAPKSSASKAKSAVDTWHNAEPASGTLVERYLRERGITLGLPSCIRFIENQRNWADGSRYPAMISLVQRVPADEDEAGAALIASGAHFTFLQSDAGNIRKADTESSKLSLGQLRHGGVWLSPVEEVGHQLAVAEGIETGLSVVQITGLPTVAALSAAGMQAIRWPPQVRRLWIAADNDPVGLKAANKLLRRALASGLDVSIKIPANGLNDFNDVLRSIP